MAGTIATVGTDFHAAFQAYKRPIYDFAYRMLQNREAASDITQEVFIRLWRHWDGGGNLDNPRSWLFVLARNLCLNELRNGYKHVPLEGASSLPAPAAECNENLIRIRRAFSALEPNYREALSLREYQGFSYKEIGEILSLSEPAVKSLLFRARTRLGEIYANINSRRGDRNELR